MTLQNAGFPGGLVLAVALLASTGAGGDAAPEPPNVGEKMPDFRLTASDGKEYTLKQFLGKSAVVISWYPKAFTSG